MTSLKPLLALVLVTCAFGQKIKQDDPRPGRFCPEDGSTETYRHEVRDASSYFGGYSWHDTSDPLVCASGKWAIDAKKKQDDYDKAVAEWKAGCVKSDAIAQHKIDLELAMRTRIVSDAEFVEVVKEGPALFYQSKCPDKYPDDVGGYIIYGGAPPEQSPQSKLDDLFAQQFRLRTIQACGGKEECAQ